ncbi:hypothetical protein [Nocardia crassostreae]|uniref:hypothetical protein n=1 Tax=Nocardia crassostreae TaxID=53428 RepID=UPI00082B3851|nr:hypothetical protein [Nocardia crassostreae]
MKAIADLERSVCALEIPGLGHSRVDEHAAVHVLNSTTLAVVILCEHNARIIEEAIRARYDAAVDISTDGGIITVVRPS